MATTPYLPASEPLAPLPMRVVVDRHIPTGIVMYGYTDNMVRTYAAEQVAAERARWIKVLAAMRRRSIQKMTKI